MGSVSRTPSALLLFARLPSTHCSQPGNQFFGCLWQHHRLLFSTTTTSSSSSSRHSTSTSDARGGVVTPPSSSTTAPTTACVYEDHQHSLRSEDLPLPVWRTLQQLRAAGHTVLLVGGAVRDLLLGHTPKDYDLLTSAHLQQVKQLVDNPRVFGRTFPICQLQSDGVCIDISSMHTRTPHRIMGASTGSSSSNTTAVVPPDAAQILQAGGPRAAAAAAVAATTVGAAGGGSGSQPGRHRRSKAHHHPYQHGRQQQHHWHVFGADRSQQQQQQQQQQPSQQQQPQLSWAAARRESALARDFTANCLLYDPFAGLLFDYVGGVADVKAGLLRCNGDASQRFSRDPACMLRAVRCAARTGLTIDSTTQAALQQHSRLVRDLNSHRVTAELQSMLGYGAAAASMQLLAQMQLLPHLLPLHAAYMQRHKQHGGWGVSAHSTSSSGSSNTCSSSSSVVNTPDASAANRPDNSTCSAGPGAAAGQEPLAASALGQLWSQLHTSHQPPQQQQQQQQQQEHTHDPTQARQQFDCHPANSDNRLLQVLAALDEHVSVSQPAPAEVLLACLTVPVLVEGLTEAVMHLQQLQHAMMQQQQHPTQPGLAAAHLAVAESQGAMAAAGAADANDPELLQALAAAIARVSASTAAAATASSSAAATAAATAAAMDPAAFHLLLPRVPAHAAHQQALRPFSSSSSAVAAGGGLGGPSSGIAATVVAQLLEGVPAADCMRQQAQAIATQVCQPVGAGCGATDGQQQYTAPTQTQPLFGVHTQAAAADLLLAQLQLAVQQQQHEDEESSSTAAPPTASKGSRPQQQQQQRQKQHNKHKQQEWHANSLWDDYAAALPRSNRQFVALMQRQWDQQLHAGFAGGHLTPGAVVMCGGGADADARRAMPTGTTGTLGHADDEGGTGDEVLLAAVLKAAGIDLAALQQALQQLQHAVGG